MNAYKCDICGKFYSKIEQNVINSNSKNSWKVRLGDQHHFVEYCSECVAAIQKVIDDRVNINDTEV